MQLNITNGNDVRLHILLMRDGSPFRADDSTDVSCALISLYGKRIQLPSFADQKDGSLIADIGHCRPVPLSGGMGVGCVDGVRHADDADDGCNGMERHGVSFGGVAGRCRGFPSCETTPQYVPQRMCVHIGGGIDRHRHCRATRNPVRVASVCRGNAV